MCYVSIQQWEMNEAYISSAGANAVIPLVLVAVGTVLLLGPLASYDILVVVLVVVVHTSYM